LLALAFIALVGCVYDQANPYANYHAPKIDFPSLDPNRYHWDGLQDPFYEGWFFRVAIPDQGRSFAFLYVVLNPGSLDETKRRAFVVVADSEGRVVRTDFSADDFRGSKHELDVRIGDHNRATTSSVAGDITSGAHHVRWSMNYDVQETWTDTMGTLTNVPYIPINWYVGALRGQATGMVEWDGKKYSFTNATLFQDKNWGSLFPTSYIWLQGMNFSDSADAVAFSGGPSSGTLAGMFVWQRGDQRFAARTQDLNIITSIDVDPHAGEVEVDIVQDRQYFILNGRFAGSTPAIMPAPTPNGFDDFSQMALTGELQARRYELVNGQWLLRDNEVSTLAGVEIGGQYNVENP
jgi:tocopherol cyclase